MRSNEPNARLWVYWNGGWIKLTLRPGDVIELRSGGRTDEGWTSYAETYTHLHDHLECETANCGCDCDGPLDRFGQYACDLDKLQSLEPNEYQPAEIMLPEWRELSRWQRDYYAEAAGY